jgi:cobalt-zinc-cadmium efflux system protein
MSTSPESEPRILRDTPGGSHSHGSHSHGSHSHGAGVTLTTANDSRDASSHIFHRGHSHGVSGAHSHGGPDGRLGWIFWLILSFMLVEAVGGYISGSLTLLADAGHMLIDTLALALAYFAQKLSQRPASAQRTFGYSRLQVLAAFVNSLLLIGIVVGIVVEAIDRLRHPTLMSHPLLALVIAMGGMSVNAISAWVLHRGHEHDLNLKAAYLHVLSDFIGATLAAVAAILVMTTGWQAADAILSLAVTVLIGRFALQLMLESAHVLQEGAPAGFNADVLAQTLLARIPALTDVHHIHAWQLTQSLTLLTLHARFDVGQSSDEVLKQIKSILHREFAIEHSTIQLESSVCGDLDCH